MSVTAVIVGGQTAYNAGKSFLNDVKDIFKKNITPKGGVGLLYRYADNPIGMFAVDTGQHFGSASNALQYLKMKGKTTTNPTDYLVYLPAERHFSNYSLVGSKLWDRNVVPWGKMVTEAERITLKTKGVYNERPATSIPSQPSIGSPKDGSVISDGTTPTTTQKMGSIMPVIGIIGLLISAGKS